MLIEIMSNNEYKDIVKKATMLSLNCRDVLEGEVKKRVDKDSRLVGAERAKMITREDVLINNVTGDKNNSIFFEAVIKHFLSGTNNKGETIEMTLTGNTGFELIKNNYGYVCDTGEVYITNLDGIVETPSAIIYLGVSIDNCKSEENELCEIVNPIDQMQILLDNIWSALIYRTLDIEDLKKNMGSVEVSDSESFSSYYDVYIDDIENKG